MTTLHGIEVKLGDKVWHSTIGWCTVLGLYENADYPIKTENGNYNETGQYLKNHILPSLLFWQEFEIPAHAFKKPKVMVKKYLVLYEYNKLFYTTANTLVAKYFLNKEDFCNGNPDPNKKFISLIIESETEFDE